MFNEIIAPNLSGDGTGCDNMTAILVNFEKNPGISDGKVENAEKEGDKSKGTNGDASVKSDKVEAKTE